MFVYNYFEDVKPLVKKPSIRWMLLFLIAILTFTANYAFDLPSSLQFQLQYEVLNINASQYSQFYGSFSFLNIFVSLLVGYLIEAFHVRFVLFAFTFMMTIGQIIFIIGLNDQNYITSLIGRILVGLGCENFYFLISYFLNRWFKPFEFGFAIGINISVYRLGSSLVSLLSPYLYKKSGILLPNNVCLFFIILCVISSLFINKIERTYRLGHNKVQSEEDLLQEQESPTSIKVEKFKLKDIKDFSTNYWILVIICFLTFGSIFTFQGNFNLFLVNTYNISTVISGQFIFLLHFISIFNCLVFGRILDKQDNKMKFIRLSNILQIIVLILYMILPFKLIFIPLYFHSLYFSVFVITFWKTLGQNMTKLQEKIGFSIVYSAFGLGLFVIFTIYGAVKDKTFNYLKGNLFSCVFIAICPILSILISFKIKESEKVSKISIYRNKKISLVR